MSNQGFLAAALNRFHSGLKDGSGKTETIQVGPKGDRAGGPYFKALAAAGLGGLILTTALAGGAQAAAPDRHLDHQVMSMVQVDTNSPRLGLHADDWHAFSKDSDLLVIDLRDDTETFGEGADVDLLAQLKRSWAEVENVAVVADRDKFPGFQDKPNPNPERDKVCAIFLGGPMLTGTVEEKAAVIGGVFQRGADGAPQRLDMNRPATGSDRISITMTDQSLDDFIAYHEMGHCADADFRALSDQGMDEHERSYRTYLSESYADAFATIMTARSDGNTRAVREFADLRMLSTASTGSFMDLAKWGFEGDTPVVVDNAGAKYHTTPTIDATVTWIESVGTDHLRSMAPQDIVEKAREMVDVTKLSPDAYGQLKNGLVDTRMDGERMLLGPDLPEGFTERLQEAMSALAYRPQVGDAPDLATSAPSWMADMEAPASGELSIASHMENDEPQGMRMR